MSKKMLEATESKNMIENDEFLADFTAKKDHVIVQNDDRFEFKTGQKASETNSQPIPSRYRETLVVEGVLRGEK